MKNKEFNSARCTRPKKIDAADEYPGIAINDGDKNRVSDTLVKERTRTLNNNPRNDK